MIYKFLTAYFSIDRSKFIAKTMRIGMNTVNQLMLPIRILIINKTTQKNNPRLIKSLFLNVFFFLDAIVILE